jgi:uncharacterized membrane protein
MKKTTSKEFLDTMSREPGNYKGIFYVNKKDPRILVPKMNPSMGWTLNFGHPVSYIGLGVLLLIIIISEIYF